MGSASKKKKSEKLADFKKPKLKVGKAKGPPSNATNTSFKSKTIVLASQSLHATAPALSSQLSHHLSLLTHHSPATRKSALSFLANNLPSPTLPASTWIPTASPLILDTSKSVRDAVKTLLEGATPEELRPFTGNVLLYVYSAASHIAPEIRMSAPGMLDVLLDKCGVEAVRGGGWSRGIMALLGVLGWGEGKIKTVGNAGKEGMEVLGRLLEVGLEDNEVGEESRNGVYGLPRVGGVYDYLGLWSEEGEAEPEDVDARRRWLKRNEKAKGAMKRGLEVARKEAGEVGRIAKRVEGVLDRGLSFGDDAEDVL